MSASEKPILMYCPYCHQKTRHTVLKNTRGEKFWACTRCNNKVAFKKVQVYRTSDIPDVDAPETFLDVPAVIQFNNDYWKEKKRDERKLKRAKKRADACGCNSCKTTYRNLLREFKEKYN